MSGWDCILQGAIAQYNEVFGVLLELRMMSLQLQRLWLGSVHRHGNSLTAKTALAVLLRTPKSASLVCDMLET